MRPGSAWARVPTPRAPRGQGDRSPEDAGPTEQVSLPGGVGTRPACPGAPPGRSTHAWMRLARSFCEGLVPGVPKGLWPPEIMPDMLQREPLTRRRFSPPPLIDLLPGVWPRRLPPCQGLFHFSCPCHQSAHPPVTPGHLRPRDGGVLSCFAGSIQIQLFAAS